jgi:hypothetical protein
MSHSLWSFLLVFFQTLVFGDLSLSSYQMSTILLIQAPYDARPVASGLQDV